MGDRRRHAGAQGTLVGRYLLGRVVGKGVSSEVRLATDTANNDLVALKIMQKEWIWRNDMSSVVRREIDIMRELDHPCVVKLVEVFNSETHVFMAMEAVDGRELHAELMRYGRVDETRARDLFQQLMVAVEYLHSIGVAHRDLKLENVMLSDDGGRLKVTNFGLAARLGEWEGGAQQKKSSSSARQRQWRQQTACDTPAYAAPEVIGSSDEQRYDARGVDTWCAGVCLYAIVTGSLPFQGSSVDDTLDAVRTQEPKLPEHLSPMLTDLLRGMLHKDPSKRLGVPEVLSHPWTLQQQNPDNVASPLQPGEIEDQEDLAEAARLAIREARLAASEAERAAAAAQAAETNAAKALAAVKLASTLSASRPGAVRPAIKRSSSVGSSSHHNHRRSASVDSRYDGPGGVAAEATAVRQDQEWSSGGGRDRTWSADDSVCAGAAGGGGGGAAGDLQNEGYRPPPPTVAENGGGGGGGARGPGGLVATAASAMKGLVARRTKPIRSQQSSSHGGGVSGGAEGDSSAKAADRDDAVPASSKALQREASPGEGSPPANDGAGKRLHPGRRLGLGRSLSSAFAATSSARGSAALTGPPPIEHGMSFELLVSPAIVPTTTTAGEEEARVLPDNPHLIAPDEEADADADAAVASKLEPAAEAQEQQAGVVREPTADVVDKTPDTAEAEAAAEAAAGGGLPSLSTAPTMSMSPPKQQQQQQHRPPNSAGGLSASSPLGKKGPPPPPPSSEPALVSPLGTAATTPPAVGSAGTVPGQPPPASGLHHPEHIPSSPGLFLVTPASSSTSQPPAEEDSPVAGAEQQQQKPGNNAWVGSWGSSSGVLADGDEAVSRRTAGPGSVAAPCGELLPAEDGGAVSRGGASESSPCEGPGERDGAELPLASDMARDTGAEESVDEEANGAPIKQPGENFTVEAPPSTSPPAAEKEAEKAEGPPPVLANGVEKDPSAEDSGATAVAAAAAAAAAAATATVEKLFNDTAAGDPQAGSSVTATAAAAAAASPSVGAGAVRGAGAVDGVAADGDGDVLSPAAAPADTETTSAKTRPLLRSTPVAEAPLTKATGASNKSDDAPVATAVPYTKSDLPAAPTALHGGGSQETRQAQAPLSSPSEAREVQESATTATTTEEPKAPQHPPPSTSHGALAGEASDDTSPATTGDTAVPASATETATASPRASGVKNNEEKEVPGTSPQEPREPSAEAPAEAAESAAVAGREHRAVASNSAEAAADEDETVAETAAGRTGEEGRVESSTSAEGAVPVAAGGKGRPVSTAGVAVGKAASAPVPGGAVGTPTTSLEGKVTDAEHPVSTDAAAGDESGLPLSPPSYEDLFSGASEEEGGGAKDEDATGDTQGEGPAGAGAGHAVDEKRGEVSVSAPTMVTQPAQRPAELGVEEEEEEEEDEEEQGGEHSAGRSPTRGAVVWEAINPFAGDAGGGGGCGDTADDPSSSRSAAASRGGGTKRPPARVYQPSTFKELMTGIKETQTAEDFAEGAGCDDDDAESRYRGDEQEGDDGGARAGEGVRAPAAATNIRKLAEAESIWGTGPADAGANEETPARRAVSGKYLRNNGQIRPQSLQRPQGRGRQGERGKDRPVSTEPQRHSITPAGYALGRPSAVCESSVDAKPAAGTGLEKADKAAGKQAAVEPRKRGKSIGKKISRIFGRKTAVK